MPHSTVQPQPLAEPSPRIDPPASSRRRPNANAFAAIDLGTNACRLMIGTPTRGGLRVLESHSRVVRLGDGLQRTGRLDAAAMDRAIAAVQACAARIARYPVRRIRAVATEACRQASNQRLFLARVRAETGIELEIIPAREEIALVLESCAPLLKASASEDHALLFDIGGGSTELAWLRLAAPAERNIVPELIGFLSIPVGVLTLSERFPGPDTPGRFAAMMNDISPRLAGFEAAYGIASETARGRVRLLGTSGTVTTLASLAFDLPKYSRRAVDGATLSAAQAQATIDRIRALGSQALGEIPSIGRERSPLVLPGCAIFAAIHALWPASSITVADRGLREGMLLRMIRADRDRRITDNK